MRLSEAKNQIEHDHPEIDGDAKLAANNPDPDWGNHTGIAWVVIALDWWTFVGMCVAIAGLFTAINNIPGIFWPALVQPHWLGALLGFVGFFTLTGVYGVLDERGRTRRLT